MNTLNKRIGIAAALVSGMLLCGVASATPKTMDFDGLTDGTSVHNYYNGGCSTAGFLLWTFDVDCHGPNYGVKWKGAHARSAFDEPSAPNWAGPGLLSDGTMTMNVAGGFDTGLNFYYTTFAKAFTGAVTVFSGKNGHGTALGHMDLLGTGIYCDGDIPCWLQTGLGFTGLAKSVIFDGFGLAFGLDDVTIGANLAATPVPEPAALGMFGLGALLIGGFVALRRLGHQS